MISFCFWLATITGPKSTFDQRNQQCLYNVHMCSNKNIVNNVMPSYFCFQTDNGNKFLIKQVQEHNTGK
jgi:hypothetical protein